MSAMGPGLGDRGMSMLDPAVQASYTLGAYQPDGQAGDYMTDLPSESLSLLRAGSSINLDTLMADRNEESAVDAIHVTVTPYGFPAFSASTPTAPATLLGFYQYDESTTFLAFVPISKFPTLTTQQLTAMQTIYRDLKQNESPAETNPQSRILTRQHCVTLDRLKEEALLLHYASQARSAPT